MAAFAALLQQNQANNPDVAPEPIARRTRQTKLDKACLMLYGTLGTLIMFVSPLDGQVILFPMIDPATGKPGKSHAELRAAELSALAEEQPWLKDLIFQLVEKSALVSFIAGHAALAGALMQVHGTSPRQLWGNLWSPVRNRPNRSRQQQEQPNPAMSPDMMFNLPQEPDVSPENAASNGLNQQALYNDLLQTRR